MRIRRNRHAFSLRDPASITLPGELQRQKPPALLPPGSPNVTIPDRRNLSSVRLSWGFWESYVKQQRTLGLLFPGSPNMPARPAGEKRQKSPGLLFSQMRPTVRPTGSTGGRAGAAEVAAPLTLTEVDGPLIYPATGVPGGRRRRASYHPVHQI